MMPSTRPTKICWVSVRPRRGVAGVWAEPFEYVLPEGAGSSGDSVRTRRVSPRRCALHPQGPRRQLSRIEARGPTELALALRQHRLEPPLIGAAAGRTKACGPFRPPRGKPLRDRLDDEDARPLLMGLDETGQQPAAHLHGSSLTEYAARMPCPRRPRMGARSMSALPCVSRDAERAVRPVRFRDRPRMPIEAVDRAPAALNRPGGACGAGAAAEIENLRDVAGRLNRADDLARHEEVERPIEEGKGRALAGAFERTPFGELRPALDVAGRERAKRTRGLRRA